jgi:hypothetical protein
MLGRTGQACQLEQDAAGVLTCTCCSHTERAMPSAKHNFQKKKHGANLLLRPVTFSLYPHQ